METDFGEILADDASELVRETQKQFRFLLDTALAFIAEAKNPDIAAWQVAYALGSPVCAGISMQERARELEITKAALSKGAVAFCRQTGIEPSQYMLPKKKREAYRELRHEQEASRPSEGNAP